MLGACIPVSAIASGADRPGRRETVSRRAPLRGGGSLTTDVADCASAIQAGPPRPTGAPVGFQCASCVQPKRPERVSHPAFDPSALADDRDAARRGQVVEPVEDTVARLLHARHVTRIASAAPSRSVRALNRSRANPVNATASLEGGGPAPSSQERRPMVRNHRRQLAGQPFVAGTPAQDSERFAHPGLARGLADPSPASDRQPLGEPGPPNRPQHGFVDEREGGPGIQR